MARDVRLGYVGAMQRLVIPSRTVAALAAALVASGCSASSEDGSQAVTLPFRAVVGTEGFDCTKTYANIGVEKATVAPQDFRFYVHDVALVAEDGTEVKVALDDDGVWQRDGVALLDFESGIGSCSAGTRETNTAIVGRVPGGRTWKGLRFKVGVPEAANHLDSARAPAPLNEPGLWWSWKGGYKYARIDIETPGQPKGFYFHLGATGCTGDTTTAFTCAAGNVAPIALTGFDPGRSTVVVDLAKIFAQVAVNRGPDMQADFVAGCMSGATDPDCPTMMGAFGLGVGSTPAPATQTVFEVR
jgi:uncharacterized repeat protein (TIGR04052 family)